MVDAMLNKHLINLEQDFVTQGGIKERMHAARTGYRQQQDQELQDLRDLVKKQAEEIQRFREIIETSGIKV
jgi:four helix bundle suffix protein